ncbi:DUF6221 family protein [Streptomyces cyaneofuscatus]|uniref:DUF6221 family protein n=1 Tax=Streptomyces cyaneofuscatus TaxID=66883 RepID=UPI0033A5BD57
MTDGLVAFVKARLNDDELTALAASAGPWRSHTGPIAKWLSKGNLVHLVWTWDRMVGNPMIMTEAWADSQHIARQDPARTLREVKAARAVLALYEEAWERMDRAMDDSDTVAYQEARTEQRTLRKVLLCEAAVHEAHPDYLEEWGL